MGLYRLRRQQPLLRKSRSRLLLLALAAAIPVALLAEVVVNMVRLASAADCADGRHVCANTARARGCVREMRAKLCVQANIVVRKLAELRIIHAQDLRLLVAAQTHPRDEVHQPQDDRRHHERVAHARRRVRELVAELHPVVVEPTAGDDRRAVELRDARLREERRRDVADEAADGVRREDVEAVVVPEDKLELRREVADRAREHAVRDRRGAADESRAGGDSDKAGDRARAEADGAPFALEAPVPEHPGQPAHRRREVGDDARLDGAQVRGERRAAVEAEPAEPEEDGAEHDVGGVVGLVREALGAVAAAAPEVDADGERGGAGGDVHGRAAGEVEPAEDEGPAVGVPGPARDGVVDEGRPDEDEDEDGADARVLGERTDGEHGRDGGEHELVDAEEDGGDARAADGRFLEDALERKVLEVANVRRAGLGEGEREAPEEPLRRISFERCDMRRHAAPGKTRQPARRHLGRSWTARSSCAGGPSRSSRRRES